MQMYLILKSIHDKTAITLMVLLFGTVVFIIVAFLRKSKFTKMTKGILLLVLIVINAQLVIGLWLYFLSPLGYSNLSLEAIKNPITGFFILRHPLTMVASATLITIGYCLAKNIALEEQKRIRVAMIYYVISFALLLTAIPWFLWF